MIDITVINTPSSSQIQPIIEGVQNYGESQVEGNAPIKRAFHIKRDGALIGGIVGSQQFERFYMSHLWIAEHCRAQGYGTQLLAECESVLKEHCSSIILETLNAKAVNFYLKNDYEEVGRIHQYVKGFDLVHLLKKLV